MLTRTRPALAVGELRQQPIRRCSATRCRCGRRAAARAPAARSRARRLRPELGPGPADALLADRRTAGRCGKRPPWRRAAGMVASDRGTSVVPSTWESLSAAVARSRSSSRSCRLLALGPRGRASGARSFESRSLRPAGRARKRRRVANRAKLARLRACAPPPAPPRRRPARRRHPDLLCAGDRRAYAKAGRDPAGAAAAGTNHASAAAASGRAHHRRARWKRCPPSRCRSSTTRRWAGSAPPALGQLRPAVPRLAQRARTGPGAQALVPSPRAAHRRHVLRLAAPTAARVAIAEAARSRAARVLPRLPAAQRARPRLLGVDARIPLQRRSFPFAAPAHRDAYPRCSPARCTSAPRRPAPLRRALAGAAAAPRREALSACWSARLPLMVLRTGAPPAGAAGAAGAGRASGPQPQRRGAGRALHVSTRTLHRQLRDEGASLQALKDEARRSARRTCSTAPRGRSSRSRRRGLSQREELLARFPCLDRTVARGPARQRLTIPRAAHGRAVPC